MAPGEDLVHPRRVAPEISKAVLLQQNIADLQLSVHGLLNSSLGVVQAAKELAIECELKIADGIARVDADHLLGHLDRLFVLRERSVGKRTQERTGNQLAGI